MADTFGRHLNHSCANKNVNKDPKRQSKSINKIKINRMRTKANVGKALNRLTISRQGFDRCQQFLGQLFLDQKYGTLPYEACLLSAIIFYARPFSCNEINQTSNADSKIDNAVLDQLTHNELKLHKKILNLRNKAIAHAEWAYYPTNVAGNGVIQSRPFSIWSDLPPDEVRRFADLAEKILYRAHHLAADRLREMQATPRCGPIAIR